MFLWLEKLIRDTIVYTGGKEERVCMMKKLIRHGNSRAIVVDKALLEAAGLNENTLFQVTVNPSGGLVIQSLEQNPTEIFQKNFEELNLKYKNLMKRLADL